MVVKHVKAATLVEFVIALSIIGICFTVASYIFIQSNRSTIQFQEVREQTEFQSELFDSYIQDTLLDTKSWSGTFTQIEQDKGEEGNKDAYVYRLQSSSKLIWSQTSYYHVSKK